MKPLQVLAALILIAPALALLGLCVLGLSLRGVCWPESVTFEERG